jgi:hypothetical protein
LIEFLEQVNKDYVPEPHDRDMIRYRRTLYHVENFESRLQLAEARPNAREQILYGVLHHVRFFNRSLFLAVGKFKYHLRSLSLLDFESLAGFIRSAEVTKKRLSKRKINDVLRMRRLREMIDERKKILEKYHVQWDDLTAELMDITGYIRENLVRIERLCRRSVRVLAESGLTAKKERQLLEDIKALFKARLKDALHYRTVTTDDVAKAKQEVGAIAAELRAVVQDDIVRMTAVYNRVGDHVKRSVGELDDLLAEIERTELAMEKERIILFRRIEQAMVTLISNYPEQLDPAGAGPVAAGRAIVEGKRQEVLAFLFEELRRESRLGSDRRKKRDRRRKADLNYPGPERRTGDKRRSGGTRRT